MTARPRFYVEYPVCEELRPYLDCFWSSGDAPVSAGASYPILPDGCVDIVFRFGTRPGIDDRLGPSACLEQVLIVGPMSRAVWMSQDPSQAWMGARFRPGRGFPFLRTPLSALLDLTPEAGEILNRRDLAGLRRVGEVRHFEDRLGALESGLLDMSGQFEKTPGILIAGINRLQATGGDVRIDDLCSEIGVSRQHFGREFAKHVGLSPKCLSRVLRFREVIRRIRETPNPNWADLAVDLGYYDQAHLILEFSRFSGISPERYRRTATWPLPAWHI